MISLFSSSLPLLALDSRGVLIGLGLVALMIGVYVYWRKQQQPATKKSDKVLRNTQLNKSVGLTAAVALVLIAMSWTTPYKSMNLLSGNLIDDLDATQIDILPTPPAQKLPPPVPFDPPKLLSEKIQINNTPEPKKEKPTSTEGTNTGTGKNPVTQKGPILPKRPVLSSPPVRVNKEPEIELAKDFAEIMPRFEHNSCEGTAATNEQKKLCADQAMKSYLSKIVRYPAMAREAQIQGTVYVRFVVEKDGSISNIEMLKDNTGGGGLANAATRAIQKMAAQKSWLPGLQRGTPVRVRIVVPVKFQIKE